MSLNHSFLLCKMGIMPAVPLAHEDGMRAQWFQAGGRGNGKRLFPRGVLPFCFPEGTSTPRDSGRKLSHDPTLLQGKLGN